MKLEEIGDAADERITRLSVGAELMVRSIYRGKLILERTNGKPGMCNARVEEVVVL